MSSSLSSLSELEIRQALKDDFGKYASRCLQIRTKTGAGAPLILNRTQLHIHEIAEAQRAETGKVRIIVVKGRQGGVSTYVEGRFYWRVTHQKGVRAFILTHEDAATQNIFEIANRFHDHCPELVKPHTGAANANELNFDLLDSGYKVGTARTKGTGRSATLQFFHGSEVGFWANAEEHVSGVMQAIPDMPGTEVWLESTGNGVGNYLHAAWQMAEAGESDYKAVFAPWFWNDEYRRDEAITLTPEERAYADYHVLDARQMAWRRAKIVELKSELLFRQEYPATAVEAFQATGAESFIPVDLILKARKAVVDPYGALVVGVDPARFGDDRTAIAFRRARKVTKVDTYVKKDTMEVAGICARILKNHQPRTMFIDEGGMGAGVIDRLRELGWGDTIIAVNFGGKAAKDNLYANKGAEMAAECKMWFESGPVQIPDEDWLQADIQNQGFKYDSSQRLVMERKEDMKKRGIRSPDGFDSIKLTFASPIGPDLPPLAQEIPEFFGVNG